MYVPEGNGSTLLYNTLDLNYSGDVIAVRPLHGNHESN
jgi:hypothetical protein